MEFKERLRIAMEFRNATSYQIGKNTRVSKQSIINYLNGTNPSNDAAVEIANYLDVSTSWLLAEEGDMIKTNPNEILDSMRGAVRLPSDTIDEAKIKMQELMDHAVLNTVPLLPISAQAGTLNDFVVSIKGSDAERIISPIKGADFAITVSGDSMAPEYPNGSQILIKKINENSFIEWGKVYVLDTNNGVVVKILNEIENAPNYLLCTSINSDQTRYAPFRVPRADILGVYRVMLCMSLK